MSITDELRKWAHEHVVYGMQTTLKPPAHPLTFGTKEEVLSIADRIDAAYERGLMSEYSDGAQEVMSGDGYIELPKDADGVPIRVGDEVQYLNMRPEHVTWVAFGEHEMHVNTDSGSYTKPELLRHHHAPTVEDVLTELEGMRGGDASYGDVVTRCAELAKMLRELLQLKEVDE